ncbi:hypothetical protein CXB51_018778 [Gossypium anomalum]|uniref:Reverse transcriptase zinc-binding domain-containing protein n=1 Tax=Gossypium anomalum TaxID=47600 RepID=A0A8J6CUQ3_9ROSI|nr:hypothetical protein CXB51_018778 [Gossypium anomalum]
MQIELVSDLIDNTNRKWRAELISNTFQPEVTRSILQIPLSKSDHEGFQVWKGALIGTYSIRSAYKLLQIANLDPSDYLLQTESKDFFRKLWNLQLPPKVTITIWCISWNYIPTLRNLRHRRIVSNARCLRCGYEVEDYHHIFRQCPTSIEGTRNEFLVSNLIIHANIASPFAAEAHAGLDAVKLGIEMGFQEVQILGDSSTSYRQTDGMDEKDDKTSRARLMVSNC